MTARPKTIILAGGPGTQLSEVAVVKPRAMLETGAAPWRVWP